MASELISRGVQYTTLPESYIRSPSERPRLDEVILEPIPVLDIGGEDRGLIVKQIGEACKDFGFFQVINHGIERELKEKIMDVAREFFHMPIEEKSKFYSDDPAKKMRLSTSFNVKKETVHNWRDYLRLHCHPLHEYSHEWPATPSSFKDVVSKYCIEVRELGLRLLEYVSESLGLESEYMSRVLGEQGQHMAINYYPPCPEPELTYGLPAHTDPNALTILLQDQEVAGLQVLKHGRWIAVNPHPDAFVINIGDQIQALSNGIYKSVCHRAVVNLGRERFSVASFLCPQGDSTIGPARGLATGESPAIYRDYTYDEYYKKFWSRNLDDEHCLELFKRDNI